MARALFRMTLIAWLLAGSIATLRANESDPSGDSQSPENEAEAEAQAQDDPPAPMAPGPELTPAEQIARLRGSIADDGTRLEELRDELDADTEESDAANEEFREIEQKVSAKLAEIEAAGQAEAPIEPLQDELAALQKSKELVDQRRVLAAADLKTLNDQIATLETKLAQNNQALQKLLGEAPAPSATTPTADPTSPVDVAVVSEGSPAPSPSTAETESPEAESAPGQASSAEAVQAPPEEPKSLPKGMLPGLGSVAKIAGGEPPAASPPAPADPKLTRAREAAQEYKTALEQAEGESASLTARLKTIDEQIRHEVEARDTARLKIDNAEATGIELAQEFQAKLFGDGTVEEKRELQNKIRENEKRLLQARAESRGHNDEITRLQNERNELNAQYRFAKWRADATRSQLDRAESTVKKMENPFTFENIVGWLLNHGVKIVAIILGMIGLRWTLHKLSTRIVSLLSQRGQRGTTAEKEHRISTLVGVFDNAASVGVVIGGILMLCQEAGVPIGPLLGGAAVFGLAIAFGAQNLIRDYFYGFVVLLENQYKLNDVIRIRNIAGQVEAITLRVTVLRDLEGCVHFVPNGEITSVTNMTHGWSRALFEIGVAYKENVDRVMEVIMDVGKDLRKDPRFRMLMLEDPTMLGVDSFGDSAVVIKFFIKTRPLQQWAVKRELLRRIKNTFDELGIEIPFPHRTVYHVGGSGHAGVPEPHGDLSGSDEVIVAGRTGPGAAIGR